MIKILKSLLIIFIFIFPLFSTTATLSQTSNTLPYPKIDGFWSPGEWPSSILHTYVFNNYLQVQFGYRINATDIFMTARYKDTTPSFYNSTNPKYCGFYPICSDGFAVGFDRNGDQVNMGTPSSPDDAVFIGIQGNYSIDAYMIGARSNGIVYDTQVGGVNNTFGRYSYNYKTQYFTYEMVKALNSGDQKGYDISLKHGDSIYVMLAYWNNLPPRTDISGYSEWIRITIIDPVPPSLVDYLIPIVIALVIVIIFASVPVFTYLKKNKS